MQINVINYSVSIIYEFILSKKYYTKPHYRTSEKLFNCHNLILRDKKWLIFKKRKIRILSDKKRSVNRPFYTFSVIFTNCLLLKITPPYSS